jgi:hypothetical protein
MKPKFFLFPLLTLFLLVHMTPAQVMAQDHTGGTTVQSVSAGTVDPTDPAFRARYAGISFGDQFSLMVLSDETNFYYLVDFSQLRTKFQKVYFMNLVFGEKKIVNIDSDLSQDRVWFLSNNKNSVKEITDLFLSLKQKTEGMSEKMTTAEQEAWLKVNNKYK